MHGTALAAPSEGATTQAARSADAARDRARREAAEQFEAVMLRELVQVMRRTAPRGGLVGEAGGASAQYLSMFDETFADHLAASGGIGLAALVEGATGGAPATLGTTHSFRAGQLPVGPTAEYPGDPDGDAVERLQAAAQDLLAGGGARRFAREGTLLPEDLGSTVETEAAGGVARFNVNDARGYRGYYKCNLFAFELARRAGFHVPVVGRAHGWGYPGPTAVTEDAAADRRVDGAWARVVSGASASTLDASLARGERAFMLTGSSTGDRQGHVAVLERVHDVSYAPDGRVARVVFDGWEAREDGARHLVARTWNGVGARGGHDARGGFDRIEILELRPVSTGARPEVEVGGRPGASDRDLSR